MSVSKAIVGREWRQLKAYFVLFTLLHIIVIGLSAPWHSEPRRSSLLLGPLLLAAAIVVERVYLEHRRGAWLLLPISRSRQTTLRLGFYTFLLLAHMFIGTLFFYTLLCSNEALLRPWPPLGEFLWETMSTQLAMPFVLLTLGWVASIHETKWSWLWLCSAFSMMGLLSIGTDGIDQVSPGIRLAPGFHVPITESFVVAVGWSLVRKESAHIGAATTLPLTVLRALGLTPTFVLALASLSAFSESRINSTAPPSSRTWRETHMLSDGDGEVVVLDVVDGVERTGRRRNGEAVRLPWSEQSVKGEAVHFKAPEHLDEWSMSSGEKCGTTRMFVSNDRRRALLFDMGNGQSSRSGSPVGCWGTDGIVPGRDCSPFAEDILSLSHIPRASSEDDQDSFDGVRLVTSTRIVDRDHAGTLSERFRGRGILSTIMLSSAQGVVFTRDETYLVGDSARACPAIPPGEAALLSDGTLAVVHPLDAVHQIFRRPWSLTPASTVTFCSPDGVLRDETWPASTDRSVIASGHHATLALLFPLSLFSTRAAPSFWAALVALRVLGFVSFVLLWRKRGFWLSLPGLLLGPSYFLSAASLLGNIFTLVENAWQRMARRAGEVT